MPASKPGPQYVYHRIDPTKTTPGEEPSCVLQGALAQGISQPLRSDFQDPCRDELEAKHAAVLVGVGPITPLQYPTVRPELLLGPYETLEEARKEVVEYAITQGYMLVSTGHCRDRTATGKDEEGRPRVTRINMSCHKGGVYMYKSGITGKRPSMTRKTGCPVTFNIVMRKSDGNKWFIGPRMEMHNHNLEIGNLDSIMSYRRWRRMQEGKPPTETPKKQTKKLQSRAPPAADLTGLLHMAAFNGNTDMMGTLLNMGKVDIDAYDSTGRTPLHFALEGSKMDACKLLVERGANISHIDSEGFTPLDVAVGKGLEGAIALLTGKGADPNL